MHAIPGRSPCLDNRSQCLWLCSLLYCLGKHTFQVIAYQMCDWCTFLTCKRVDQAQQLPPGTWVGWGKSLVTLRWREGDCSSSLLVPKLRRSWSLRNSLELLLSLKAAVRRFRTFCFLSAGSCLHSTSCAALQVSLRRWVCWKEWRGDAKVPC